MRFLNHIKTVNSSALSACVDLPSTSTSKSIPIYIQDRSLLGAPLMDVGYPTDRQENYQFISASTQTRSFMYLRPRLREGRPRKGL